MGSLPGKLMSQQDLRDIKTFHLEQKVERLESEVLKMRSELRSCQKMRNSRASLWTATSRNNERYSEPQSVELIKRRGSVVIFTEALLKAELQRLRGENHVLSKQLAGIKEPSDGGFPSDYLVENDDQS